MLEVKIVDGFKEVYFKDNSVNFVKYRRDSIIAHYGWREEFEAYKAKYRKNGLTYKHAESKAIGDLLGVSESRFKKHYNALVYKTLVDNYGKILQFCFKNKELNPVAVSLLNRNREKVIETFNDGLINLVPAVLYTGMSPKELKEALKHNWKQVVKNSPSRNKLIFRSCYETVPNDAVFAASSTMLQKGYYSSYKDVNTFLSREMKGKYKNFKEMRRAIDIAEDCLRMLAQLGKSFNCNWSMRRVLEEHSKASKEILTRKYSKDTFEWSFSVKKNFEYKDFTAVLLDSKFLIADEGKSQRHCVGSYAEHSSHGSYMVFSISCKGEKYSTLGLTRDKETGKVKFQQHYMKYNASVESEDAVELAKIIVETLNKGA